MLSIKTCERYAKANKHKGKIIKIACVVSQNLLILHAIKEFLKFFKQFSICLHNFSFSMHPQNFSFSPSFHSNSLPAKRSNLLTKKSVIHSFPRPASQCSQRIKKKSQQTLLDKQTPNQYVKIINMDQTIISLQPEKLRPITPVKKVVKDVESLAMHQSLFLSPSLQTKLRSITQMPYEQNQQQRIALLLLKQNKKSSIKACCSQRIRHSQGIFLKKSSKNKRPLRKSNSKEQRLEKEVISFDDIRNWSRQKIKVEEKKNDGREYVRRSKCQNFLFKKTNVLAKKNNIRKSIFEKNQNQECSLNISAKKIKSDHAL